ncbi:MAG TPA: serine/threonine-protein kinase [Solirubrobacteraceae bacterium]|nr:serine/threonine-protein kinase [Solirubrobacteraceae bacterium]
MESQRTLLQQRIRVEDTLVLDRYRLLEELGTGGFGTVWSAHDEVLHRPVALKRIWLGPDGDLERATREAHAGARLKHPAIVRLYEVASADDAFYLISELVEGETLARLIADDELADEEILEIGLALAEALAHAHAHGVIHRDIKPHNVLVPDRVEDGARVTAKLTDFGGASLVGEDVLTRPGDVLGTLAYMAPEQADGGQVAEQADLYSLALVIYEALCGVNPVRGATPAATARRIGRPIESLARKRRDLPRPLTQALDYALSPSPSDRGTVDRLRLVLAETLERGLRRPRRGHVHESAPMPTREAPIDSTRVIAAYEPAVRSGGVRAPRHPDGLHPPGREPADLQAQTAPAGARIALPRALWIAVALTVVAWQAFAGRSGVALLAAAALLPLLLLPRERDSHRVGSGWIAAALAPILGLVGLAAAFPALAGQASRWRWRLVLGALGYWWLTLAEPLLDRRLWLGAAPGTPAHAAWEGSIGTTSSHVLEPMLTLGVLLGATLWACGALALPWIVRGRNAAVDLVAVVTWSAAIAAAAPALDAGLSAQLTHPSPRGAVLGAVVGGLFALAARALRGPV